MVLLHLQVGLSLCVILKRAQTGSTRIIRLNSKVNTLNGCGQAGCPISSKRKPLGSPRFPYGWWKICGSPRYPHYDLVDSVDHRWWITCGRMDRKSSAWKVTHLGTILASLRQLNLGVYALGLSHLGSDLTSMKALSQQSVL